MTDTQLQRMRWAVRATLTLGVAASVTANILHARDNPISQAIAAWPPLALLITVELVSRIPLQGRGLGLVRVVATTAIAAIAAYVNYVHMVAVVARYGEAGAVPYLLPLSVDGLIVVASVSLVELSSRRRATVPTAPSTPTEAATPPTPAPATLPAAPPTVSTPDEPPTDASAHNQPEPTATIDTAATLQAPDTIESGPETDDGTDPRRTEEYDTDFDPSERDADEADDGADLAADLVPLLPTARTAHDELTHEGHPVSRDALARRLRRNGQAIRNDRVSELLKVLRREHTSANGTRPELPV